MKRKLLASILSIVLIASFGGCMASNRAEPNTSVDTADNAKDKASGDASGKIELEFFNQKKEGEGVYEEIIKLFQEENPNVIIKQVSPADAETVFFTRISTGDIPDIMSIYPAEAAYQTVMTEGMLVDLSDQEFITRATEQSLEYSRFNDKLYAMPYALSSFGIFCNKDLFDEQGLTYPKTWEELITVLQKFQEGGMEAPIVFADKDAGTLSQEGERMIGIIKSDIFLDCEKVGHGEGSFIDPDKDWFRVLASAMLKMREFAPKDTLAIGREQATADFVNGKHAMYLAGTFSFAGILDAKPDMNLEMIAIPTPYPGGKQKLPINVDIALGVSKESPYPDEAIKFLEFVSRPEIYQMMADVEGTPPVIQGVDYKIAALKNIKNEIEKGDTFLTMVNFWPPGWRSEWSIYLQNLLTDHDIDAFLKKTDEVCVNYYNQ